MTTQAQVLAPPYWPGSVPEYIAYQTFIGLGLEPGEDFTYQSPFMGGRMDKGGTVIDFLFPTRLIWQLMSREYTITMNSVLRQRQGTLWHGLH